MKVTFLLPGYPWKPAGGFRVVYEYANHLVARGHKVAVVHARRLPNWSPPPPPNPYRWLRRKAGQVRDLIFRPKVHWQPIDKQVEMLYVPEPSEQYIPDGDAVIATWWATSYLVSELSRKKGEKFYLIQSYETWGGPPELVNRSYFLGLKNIVIAKWLKETLEGLGAEVFAYVPIGINFDLFRLESPIESRGPLSVLMMYHQAELKGAKDGLKAIEIAKSWLPSLKVTLFSVCPRPIALPSWIQFVRNPPYDKLVNLYNQHAIFVSSSITEGFPLPPAEAMACGCAVVATDSGGIREYAEHEKTALLSPPRAPEALAKNLLRVLEDDNLRIQLARAGYERIKKFTWERSTDLLEKALLSCA